MSVLALWLPWKQFHCTMRCLQNYGEFIFLPTFNRLFTKLFCDMILRRYDIYHMQTEDKRCVSNLCENSYFLQYVEETLTKERPALNVSHIYQLFVNYFPKVSIIRSLAKCNTFEKVHCFMPIIKVLINNKNFIKVTTFALKVNHLVLQEDNPLRCIVTSLRDARKELDRLSDVASFDRLCSTITAVSL